MCVSNLVISPVLNVGVDSPMWTEESIELRKEAEELIARSGRYETSARTVVNALIREAERLEAEAGMKTVPMSVQHNRRQRCLW